jgi:hypothetical protein
VEKDKNRLIERLIKPIEELNQTVQAEEWVFKLTHNSQRRMIHMPDSSYDQCIRQAVREPLEEGNSAELRRFQLASMEVNQIITVLSGAVTERHTLTQASGSTR